jgi:prepilin-type N-terminal cleavage/methylation domain-containing protein
MSIFDVSQRRGFTLVEMILACAIIGILASIAYGTFTGMRERARDTQRMSDIEQLRLAMKLYKDTYGTYPDYRFGSIIGEGEPIDDELSAFFSTVPADPLGSGGGNFKYAYDSEFNCPSVGNDVIILMAESMEHAPNSNWTTVCNGVAPGTNSYAVILQR